MKKAVYFILLLWAGALFCPLSAGAQVNAAAARTSSWWNPQGAAAGQTAGSALGAQLAGGTGYTSAITGGVGYVAGGLGLWGSNAANPATTPANPSEAASPSASIGSNPGNLASPPAASDGAQEADPAAAFNAAALSAPGAAINAMTLDQFAAAAGIPLAQSGQNPSSSAGAALSNQNGISGLNGTPAVFTRAQLARARSVAAQFQNIQVPSSAQRGYESVAAASRKMGGALENGAAGGDHTALADAQSAKADSSRAAYNAELGLDGAGVSVVMDGNTAGRAIVRVSAKKGVLSGSSLVPVYAGNCEANHC